MLRRDSDVVEIVRKPMSQVFVKNERTIPASPETVYMVLADYKEQRPLILTPNFLDYKVESGGQGSGTVVSYRLRAANRERAYRMRVDEVVTGRELMERDRNSSLVTTWKLSPQDDGRQTRVQPIVNVPIVCVWMKW
jgi:uncharacterized protein YndB with AHSA1/START domain